MSSSNTHAPSQATASSSTTRTRRPSSFDMSSCAPSRSFRCTVTVNTVPLPSVDSTSTEPFIMSTTLLTMAMPSPVPSTFVVRESLARVKGSNTVFRNSSLMPQPVSANTNS